MKDIKPLVAEATKFLQARFPDAITIVKGPMPMHPGGLDEPPVKELYAIAARSPSGAVKQLLYCLSELGSVGEVGNLALQLDEVKTVLEGIVTGTGNKFHPHQEMLYSNQMAWSPVVILFTDSLKTTEDEIRAPFRGIALVEISTAASRAILKSLPRGGSKISSVFISYGGPDETIAARINEALGARGVRTWFFPKDASPGDKLHRVMSDGVNAHDRVLLLCSANSLVRNGVLNELERVLEREAREGGSSILMPVRLDDFVLTNWAPDREDLAMQVRSRVIADFSKLDESAERFDIEIGKIIHALSEKPVAPLGSRPS